MLDEALALSARRVLARAAPASVAMSAPPWFEDLQVGTVLRRTRPALTLTEGHAALHQAIAGDRLRLALDRTLGEAVLGAGAPVAHPRWCGTPRSASRRWRPGAWSRTSSTAGCCCAAPVRLGDTLRTTTEVVARRENRVKEGRRPTGLAVLRIRTVDQDDRPVLDFTRCAMLPLRDEPTGEPGDEVGGAADLERRAAARRGRRARPRRLPRRRARAALRRRRRRLGVEIEGGDVVDSAPALARLTLNVAMAHLDATRDRATAAGSSTAGTRSGSPPAQATRALPALVTILGWHACDHTAPVFEGDTLRSRIELERREPLPGGGGLAAPALARRRDARERGEVDVLDWRFVAVLA